MKPVKLLQPSQSLFDPVEMALPFLMTSLEGPKLLRGVEQSLLPDGGARDGQPAQTAARMAGDDLVELLGKPDNDALRPADVG